MDMVSIKMLLFIFSCHGVSFLTNSNMCYTINCNMTTILNENKTKIITKMCTCCNDAIQTILSAKSV